MYRSVLGFLFLFLALNLSKLTAQCITNVDFNNWNQAGDPANGNWTVQSGGSQIYQSINGQPTYFLSSFDLINVEITGQFRTDNGDDDFMGFVIGFNDPIGNNTDHDYILFDWKGVAQTYLGNHAPTGMTLSRVQGNIPVSVPVYAQYFWGHANSIPPLEVLDTHYGAGLGWVQGVDHDFRCIYTPTNIKIFVDGNLIFDVDDCFKAGRFGFYNYSQPQVTYTDFTYELATAFQIEEQNICLVDSASFIFIDACAANFNFNLIDEMEWDFGDGNSYTNSNPDAQNINPKHLYTAPGNYQVTLTTTDHLGCQDIAIENITVYEHPDVQLSVPDVCFNEDSEFENLTTPGDGNINQWNWDRGNNTTSNDFDFNYQYPDSGTYQIELIAIDDNGCSDTNSISHSVFALPQATIQAYDLTCFESNDGEIHPQITGGTTPYTYDWSNSTNDSIADNLAEGNYTLTIEDQNTCIDIISNTVNQPAPLEIEVELSDYNGFEIACFGEENGEITLITTGGTPPYQYDWNSGQFTDSTLSNLEAGSYAMVLTDSNNCQLDSIITLNEPNQLLAISTISQYNGGWNVSCATSTDGNIDITPQGGVQAYNFNWNNGSFNTEDLSNLAAGSYSLEITDQNNCVFYDTFELVAPDTLSGQLSAFEHNGGWGVSCNGASDGSISADIGGGTAPYDFNWSNNAGNTDNIDNLSAGIYQLSIEDGNGCEIIDSIEITEPDELTASLSKEDVVCYREENGILDLVLNGGTEPYSINWSDSVSDELVRTGVDTGFYEVNIVDANNCETSANATISEPDSLGLLIQQDTIEIIYGGIAEIEAQFHENGRENLLSWSPHRDLNCSDCSEVKATPVENTLYVLELFDNQGCSVLDSVLVLVKEKILYQPTAFTPDGDGTNDFFTIYSSGIRNFKMRVFTRWGELIYLTEDIESGWDGAGINGDIMPQGVYVYTAQLIYYDGEVEKIKGSVTLLR